MTLNSTIALFGAMIILAFVPSISVLAVTTRSATFGFAHGVFTTIGIIIGDIVFILIAIFGLSALAETMGDLFVLIKYLGGAYLIWLGIGLWRSTPEKTRTEEMAGSSLSSSFLTGLLITLGDQKAILFYFGFLPVFLDLSTVSFVDAAIIITIATIAIGSVKLGYACMADKISLSMNTSIFRGINLTAGTVMIAAGIFVWVKS